ncbi:MAG: hypothetical protein GY838_14725 [bacterium]|nr:hypothetical protein [bacterium]
MDELYQSILDLRDQGRSAVLVTVVNSKGHVPLPPPGKMLADAGGRLAGTVGGGTLEARALEEVDRVLTVGGTLLKDYLLYGDQAAPEADDTNVETTGMNCGGRATLFFEVIGAPHRVYIIGAGHVGQAVARLLGTMDYRPVTVDCRTEFAPDLEAGADYAPLPELPVLAGSGVIVATHSGDCDRRVLEQILSGDDRPGYVGLVASTRKWSRMADELRDKLGDSADLGQVYAPAGLRLGGRTPAEIALSIVAELQAVRTGSGDHDHLKRGPST